MQIDSSTLHILLDILLDISGIVVGYHPWEGWITMSIVDVRNGVGFSTGHQKKVSKLTYVANPIDGEV